MSIFSLFLNFWLCSPLEWQSLQVDYFFLNTRSGLPAKFGSSACILKSQRILYILFSRTYFGLCICCFYVNMIKLYFIAQFSVGHFSHPVISILVLLSYQFTAVAYYVINTYYFAAYYQFIYMSLFCAVINRDSFSHFRCAFLSYILLFSCAISPVCRLKYPCRCFSSHICYLDLVIIILLVWEFSTSALADIFSLVFEWQQVSPSH